MASETLEVTDAPATPVAPVEPPPVEDTPEQIEARLLQRQQALAGKLDVLEQQTLGSIRDTIGTVTDTVNSVQAVVADPVGAVQSAVMNPLGNIANGVTQQVTDMIQTMDPTPMIRRYPWESVGVAVAGGVVLGMVMSSRPPAGTGGGSGGGLMSGLVQSITGSFRDELAALGKQLFDTVSRSLVERVQNAVSGYPHQSPPPTNGSI